MQLGWFVENTWDVVHDEASIAACTSRTKGRAVTYIVLRTDDIKSVQLCGTRHGFHRDIVRFEPGELVFRMKFVNGDGKSFELFRHRGWVSMGSITSLARDFLTSLFKRADIDFDKVTVDRVERFEPRAFRFREILPWAWALLMGRNECGMEKHAVPYRDLLEIYAYMMLDRYPKYTMHRELISRSGTLVSFDLDNNTSLGSG
jgi:hypothetical protein